MNYVNQYSEEFKLKVVYEVLRGEITKEACRSVCEVAPISADQLESPA